MTIIKIMSHDTQNIFTLQNTKKGAIFSITDNIRKSYVKQNTSQVTHYRDAYLRRSLIGKTPSSET